MRQLQIESIKHVDINDKQISSVKKKKNSLPKKKPPPLDFHRYSPRIPQNSQRVRISKKSDFLSSSFLKKPIPSDPTICRKPAFFRNEHPTFRKKVHNIQLWRLRLYLLHCFKRLRLFINSKDLKKWQSVVIKFTQVGLA